MSGVGSGGDSPFQSNPSDNPYEASVYSAQVSGPGLRAPRRPYPVFPLVVFIVSLVFCTFRGAVGAIGIIVMTIGDTAVAGGSLALMESSVSIVAALTGFVANGLMLARKASGIQLAWVHIAAVVLTLLITGWLSYERLSDIGDSPAVLLGVIIGGGIALVFRVGIVVVYMMGVFSFRRWVSGM